MCDVAQRIRKDGEKIGEIKGLVKLINRKFITVSQAAETLDMSENEFLALVKKIEQQQKQQKMSK